MVKQLSWFDADGVEFKLDETNNIRILQGLKGFQMPPFAFMEEDVPFQPGSRLRDVKALPREMDIPIKIECTTPVNFINQVRKILNTFNPTKADGRIKVTTDTGSQREINCRYIGGFEMDESAGISGETWQKAIGVFRAFDPYWADSSTIIKTYTTGQPATFFPFFPLRLSYSTVFTDTSIDNTGDVDTWPEWIITGPGSNIVLRNLTSGKIISLNMTLDVGEVLIVDTKPKRKTVKMNDGTNMFGKLSDDSSLWPLLKGMNSIRIEMSNATVVSNVQLSYKNRYWGP